MRSRRVTVSTPMAMRACCCRRGDHCCRNAEELHRLSRYIPVHAAAHTIQPARARRLPDIPAARAEARLRPETAKPERAFKICADPIALVEVRRQVKNGTLAVACLHYPQKIAKLLMEFRPRRSVPAIAGKFEVYRRR